MWSWLNGKKTFLGLGLLGLLKFIGQVKPDMLAITDELTTYVNLWIAGGVAHKIDKMK